MERGLFVFQRNRPAALKIAPAGTPRYQHAGLTTRLKNRP
jgi:hypothetical protein